ncbi:TetR/AcrR family transcriptional regulator [Actinoallomurus rhizosphaericola]|uniref:TetR/AcrR family transcriptional regulator n=1 Tax=Actinoallomurus rhizosphaericola TaxID=2952536 RepID=UPI002090835D|nr:TetR/AcrR family transcriptional regulator [Actinoallomurus rhizosphaericola]MCO5994448.1 TetR/AcrR family transcriptional regulator [Actinoallomurus rhizosphaericola]
MLEAARELFVQRGYGATTLQEIADRAGVSVQTIYFTFGNKRVLLKELVDGSIAGDEEAIATMDRPWFREAVAAETADAQLLLHVQGTREILERVAPIIEMLRAAATADPEIAELWGQDTDPRFTVHAAAARSLSAKPGIRDGVTAEHTADVLYGLLSPELYLLLVRDRGWSPERWERWSYDTLRSQLCSG